MITTHRTRNTMLALGALILLLALLPTIQCGQLEEMDKAIWGTADAPAEPAPGEAPPVLELIASGLAACGFGGMAAWLRRTSNNSKKKLADLDARIFALETSRPKLNTTPSEN